MANKTSGNGGETPTNPNVKDATWQDEEKMDRVSESGMEGAFGTDQESPTRQKTLEDAKDAFGAGSSSGGSNQQ